MRAPCTESGRVCQGCVCNTEKRLCTLCWESGSVTKGHFCQFPSSRGAFSEMTVGTVLKLHNARCRVPSFVWFPRISLVGLFTVFTFCVICEQEVMHLAFDCSPKIKQNDGFSFSMIIFYLLEMFWTFLPKIGISIIPEYKMKTFASFTLELFIWVISSKNFPSFLAYLWI